MKAKEIIQFGLIFIIIGILNSCEKKDYRDDYIGNFQFTTDIKKFITDTTYTDSIVSYNGKIGYGNAENEISINYLSNSTFSVVLETDGSFEKHSGLGNCSYGKFDTKDLIKFGSCDGVGSGSIREDVTGTRN